MKSLFFQFVRPIGAAITILWASALSVLAIPPNYVVTTTSGASIVPGTNDIGNHCDDCTTTIALPFVFTFYDQSFTSANVSSNGELEFTSNDQACCGACVPVGSLNNTIVALGSDLHTDGTNGEAATDGIFTSVSGTFPNRIFNIEWVTFYHFNTSTTAHFEIRLYEGEQRFDIIYATLTRFRLGGVGVQRDTGSQFTSVSCDNGPADGTMYTFRPASCVSPPTGLVGWWPGDNNTLELIKGHNGTLQNGATYAQGQVSGAFNLDGSTGSVSIPHNANQDIEQAITMDAWVKKEGSCTNNCIVFLNQNGSTGSTAELRYGLVILSGTGQAALSFNTGTWDDVVLSNTTIQDDVWYHIAGTYDGATAKIYINGVLDNSVAKTGTILPSTAGNIFIGHHENPSAQEFFNGLIDEVELFKRALSDTEIAAIYNAGGAGKCKPMGLYAADGDAQNPNCHLYLLSPGDGSVVRDIGPIGFAITALAFDPTTGILYGGSGAFSPSPPARSIVTIDPTTGAGTLIGPEGSGGPLADVTFTSDGTLYGWGEGTDDLHTVNTSTGAATKVAESSTSTFGSGISANSANILYFGGKGPNGRLAIVDRMTGQVTLQSTFSGMPLSRSLNAFAFDPNDILYASNGGDCDATTCLAHLITINTTTAVATDLGSTIPGLDAIAFGPAFVCDTHPPTITAASGVSREQGAPSSNSEIATVSDNEDPPASLTVTVNGSASATVNGVTVSNIAVDSSGKVTADVVASCSSSTAHFTLRVTDSCDNFAEATLTITVTQFHRGSPCGSHSPTPTPTPTPTPLSSATPSPAPTPTPTPTPTPSPTAAPTPTPTPCGRGGCGPSPTPTATPISSPTPTPTLFPTATPTPTPTPTVVPPSPTPTPTATPTSSPTPTPTPTPIRRGP